MSLGKGLLARLHLKVKMYITNLLSGYNLQKISCLKEIFPWPWKLKERFLRFCFFYDLLKLHFFTRCLYFHHHWWWEKGKNQFFNYFWRILLKFEEKILEIQYSKNRTPYKRLLTTFQKSNCLTGLFRAKSIHSITRTLIALNKFFVLS